MESLPNGGDLVASTWISLWNDVENDVDRSHTHGIQKGMVPIFVRYVGNGGSV